MLPPLCGLGFFSLSRGGRALAASIMVVDDDAQQRRSLRLGLESFGFRAVEAAGGEEGLELLEARPVDLVITDLMMPGINGLALVRRLQQRFPELPVVLTSGYHLGRRQIEKAGLHVLAFVPKPYDLSELARFLHAKLTPLATG